MTDLPLWVVQFRAAQIPKSLAVRVQNQVTIGRTVQGDPKTPDVDLSAYNAEELGVSRLHCTLTAEGDRLMVTDLNSFNGTFLNSNRLKPNEAYRLSNGDHLLLGKMRLEVAILLSPAYGGDVHKQPSLQLHDQVQPGKGQLVLIVESQPEFAAALSNLIEGAGYSARVSHEVVGAIRTYNQRRPGAVVVSQTLPDMSGLEFCRYVRRDEQTNSIPIVILGDSDSQSIVNQAMDAGADIFLNKPVSARELRHVVSSLISQHESGGAAMYTKHLVGTAPLVGIAPESRKNTAVLFVAGFSDAPITLTVNIPISFGRAASTGSLRTHIDLSRYDAANTGVSRLHMFLHYKDDKFLVEDADSVNGTYINGDPIKPRVLTPVKNADEIRLGQLRMYIYFLEDRPLNGESPS